MLVIWLFCLLYSAGIFAASVMQITPIEGNLGKGSGVTRQQTINLYKGFILICLVCMVASAYSGYKIVSVLFPWG